MKELFKMNGRCPIPELECHECDCSGITCQSRFPGLKVVWPELKGVSGPEAKRQIETDNPKVVAHIIPENVAVISTSCCNRVILRVPLENCPNGPVLNHPHVG